MERLNAQSKLVPLNLAGNNSEDYHRLVLEILNYLFNPDLTDGQPEVRTFDGTERRDIIFTNESDESFWEYVRTAHDGILVMFEAKNTNDLGLTEINQTATYLGDSDWKARRDRNSSSSPRNRTAKDILGVE